MVRSPRLLLVLIVAAMATPAWAQKNRRQNPAQAREQAKDAAVDQAADQVFTQADRNHNQLLSRTEFNTAESLLETALMGLGQTGVLGQPAPPNKTGGAANGAAVFGLPTFANKNRITPTEFKMYAHTLAQEADAAWAQQRLAMQAQMRSRGRGGMWRGRPLGMPNMPVVGQQ